MKLPVALGLLSALLLGAGALSALVELGVVEIGSERSDSTAVEQGGGGSTVEATGAGEELEGADAADMSPEALARCARKARGVAGAEINPDDADALAAEAPGGVVVVRFRKNTANVSFHRTETDAENAQAEYETFAEANRRTYDERLFRNGRTVTAFETSASEDERRAVAECL